MAIQGDKYIQHDGGVCTFIKEGSHTETGQPLVAYQDHKGKLWFMPTELFHGPVVIRGKVLRRFQKI